MIGRTISHYKILEKLGEGGMGNVYRAEDVNLRRPVALKFLVPGRLDDQALRKRFLNEAQAAAALDHPNICSVYEIDEADGMTFIAMAYVPGEILSATIQGSGMDLNEVLDISRQVATGLEVAHRNGIVHRDVKCSNIFVSDDGVAKILDFGLATSAGEVSASAVLSSSGTVAYMSPEQARGDDVDYRTDVWSLGVCMYEMLAGRLPFDAGYHQAVIYSILNQEPEPLSELRPDLPMSVVDIVEKAMSRNRDDRYQSRADFLRDLESPDELPPERMQSDHPTIAVLPFVDMSPEKDQEYFCDGIAEEIINALAKVGGLDVAARTSSFAFKGRNVDIRTIGRRIGVDAVMEGSVRKANDRLRINAQIVSVADGYHIWSGQFDREIEDVFSIQEEIAQNIVAAMEVELNENEKRALETSPTSDIDAYDFYLRGRSFFYQSKRISIYYAIEMFTKATDRDPGYALAYAGLADCYSYFYMYFDRTEENLRKAVDSASRALELDGELAEAHAAYGFAVSLSKRYDEAEEHFEKAIDLNPQLFEAYYYYARTCFARGDKERATQYYERACLVDPDNHQAPNLLAFTYRGIGRRDKAEMWYRVAIKNINKRLELHPDDSRAVYLKSATLIELGQFDEGIKWADKAFETDPRDPYIVYGVACSYSRVGRVEEAIDYFEKSVQCGFAHKDWIEHDDDLDPLRSHARFRAIVDGME
ncbi:MAG: protein kinase [Candidatus Latescibacterota bacterium]|jgi:non-specific serine/threonine protein kinase